MAHPALKAIERAVRSATMKLAVRVVRSEPVDPPDWGARTHRVLYLRYDRIGDMLMATGLIRAIASSHPTIELDVLASPGNRSMLEGNPYVRRVLVLDRHRLASYARIVRVLRSARYDAVIDGMVLTPSTTTMLLMLATGAPYRIGIAGRKNSFAYTLPVPEAPRGSTVVEQAGMTALPFGVSVGEADWHYDLFLSEDELARAEAAWSRHPGRPRFLVNVSAFTPDRRWPPERYGAVVRHLRGVSPEARVLVIGDPRDREAAESAASAGGAELVHASPVREAFALVARSDALFTPDTSLAHAAAATDVPVAAMFRRGYTMFAPHGARLVSIESPGETLQELSAEAVLPALDELAALASAVRARDGRS